MIEVIYGLDCLKAMPLWAEVSFQSLLSDPDGIRRRSKYTKTSKGWINSRILEEQIVLDGDKLFFEGHLFAINNTNIHLSLVRES